MVVPFGLVALGIVLAYSGLKNKTVLETLKGLPGSLINQPYEADLRAAQGMVSRLQGSTTGATGAGGKQGGTLVAGGGPTTSGAPHWGGSKAAGLPLVKPYKSRVTSEKRSTRNTASGGISDHWTGNVNAYAWDIAAVGNKGTQIANDIATKLGHPEYKGGYWLTVNLNGYRYQLGWKVPDHFDHVHLGVLNENPGKNQPPPAPKGKSKGKKKTNPLGNLV